jgi:hypothetical protein
VPVKAQFAQLIGQQGDQRAESPESFEVPGSALLGLPLSASQEYGDADYLLSVRNHIREIVALDNRFGGADLVKLSARFFRTLHDQLGTGTYDPRIERDLHSAAGELAEVVGWLAYDSEEHDLTRRMNQESLYFVHRTFWPNYSRAQSFTGRDSGNGKVPGNPTRAGESF